MTTISLLSLCENLFISGERYRMILKLNLQRNSSQTDTSHVTTNFNLFNVFFFVRFSKHQSFVLLPLLLRSLVTLKHFKNYSSSRIENVSQTLKFVSYLFVWTWSRIVMARGRWWALKPTPMHHQNWINRLDSGESVDQRVIPGSRRIKTPEAIIIETRLNRNEVEIFLTSFIAKRMLKPCQINRKSFVIVHWLRCKSVSRFKFIFPSPYARSAGAIISISNNF